MVVLLFLANDSVLKNLDERLYLKLKKIYLISIMNLKLLTDRYSLLYSFLSITRCIN